MEDSEQVPLELQLEMPVIRQGIKELAKADSITLDAVLARVTPVLDELQAKYSRFDAIQVNWGLFIRKQFYLETRPRCESTSEPI